MSISATTNSVTPGLGVGQTPATATATDVSSVLIPSNIRRIGFTLMNTGRREVWIALDAIAVFNQGIFLEKLVGIFSMDVNLLSVGPVNGICEPGKTTTVTYQEFNRP